MEETPTSKIARRVCEPMTQGCAKKVGGNEMREPYMHLIRFEGDELVQCLPNSSLC